MYGWSSIICAGMVLHWLIDENRRKEMVTCSWVIIIQLFVIVSYSFSEKAISNVFKDNVTYHMDVQFKEIMG